VINRVSLVVVQGIVYGIGKFVVIIVQEWNGSIPTPCQQLQFP